MYPADTGLRADLRATGGHAVCLVGYEALTEKSGGGFVFRDSFGDFDFARKSGDDPAAPRAPAAGYGVVSASALDRWCRETMLRA